MGRYSAAAQGLAQGEAIRPLPGQSIQDGKPLRGGYLETVEKGLPKTSAGVIGEYYLRDNHANPYVHEIYFYGGQWHFTAEENDCERCAGEDLLSTSGLVVTRWKPMPEVVPDA